MMLTYQRHKLHILVLNTQRCTRSIQGWRCAKATQSRPGKTRNKRSKTTANTQSKAEYIRNESGKAFSSVEAIIKAFDGQVFKQGYGTGWGWRGGQQILCQTTQTKHKKKHDCSNICRLHCNAPLHCTLTMSPSKSKSTKIGSTTRSGGNVTELSACQ